MPAGRNPDVDDDELLSALASVTDPSESPVATPGDVAAEVEIGRDGTRKRLNTLAGEGRIKKRKIGTGSAFWLAPDDDRQTQLPEHEPEEEEVEEVPNADDLVAEFWGWLDGRPPKTSHARQAAADVFRAMLRTEPVTTGELREIVYSGRREKWSNEKAAWESISRYVDEWPGARKPGRGEWTVDPDEAAREMHADRDGGTK